MRRSAVITGASSGIGLAAAVALARTGQEVVLLGRDPDRLAAAVAEVRAASGRTPAAHRADFAHLDEVRAVGARLAADHERIHLYANNAGRLAPAGRRTADGHDETMQTNHLAGFLLAHLLHDRLAAAAPGRIVTTASAAEAWSTLDPDRPGRALPSRWLAYGSSKQANILFTIGAARRWTADGIVATSYFPGLVRTRFGRTSPSFGLARLMPVVFRTPEHGAQTLVWLATADEALIPGGYFTARRLCAATRRSADPARSDRLWHASLAAVGLLPDGTGERSG
jgi:NAD(P)-dependent dehydrogenase (short-subunit alcohol dehydrogenase family)